jgi:glycosyltransferase involved in cell wall biosynthesis
MAESSRTHLVLIPSYNPGPKVYATVRAALDLWNPVWVVVDGSTDDSATRLSAWAATEPGLRVFVLPQNRGKGAAVLYGLEQATALGFTHALTMDSDGQHPADLIVDFMRASERDPGAMILGCPVFDASAPLLRVRGRKICNWWVNVETLWSGIGDSLYGFRVYPITPLVEVMLRQRWMRRFDFDAEAAVRLSWGGVTAINVRAPVRYFRSDEGGVSHFNYTRDNALLTWMHVRLFAGFLCRLPVLVARRARGGRGQGGGSPRGGGPASGSGPGGSGSPGGRSGPGVDGGPGGGTRP